jgi:hypothetical protein
MGDGRYLRVANRYAIRSVRSRSVVKHPSMLLADGEWEATVVWIDRFAKRGSREPWSILCQCW